MRYLPLIILLTLPACQTTKTFGDKVGEAVDTVVNPETREVHYKREGNTIHYRRFECSGKFCDATDL